MMPRSCRAQNLPGLDGTSCWHQTVSAKRFDFGLILLLAALILLDEIPQLIDLRRV
jgi:hypothetical protein